MGRISRCSLGKIIPLFHFAAAAATGKGTGQVADQDNVVNGADDTVGDLEALEVLELEELVVDLADDERLHLLGFYIEDDILNFANEHALVRVNLKPEQLGNLGFHRYQMKVYT